MTVCERKGILNRLRFQSRRKNPEVLKIYINWHFYYLYSFEKKLDWLIRYTLSITHGVRLFLSNENTIHAHNDSVKVLNRENISSLIEILP